MKADVVVVKVEPGEVVEAGQVGINLYSYLREAGQLIDLDFSSGKLSNIVLVTQFFRW